MTPVFRLMTCLVLFACAGLGGCNLVLSEKPMFTAADAAGAPPMREGVWAAPEKDCEFDRAKPADEWPKCASASLIGAATTRAIKSKESDGVEVKTNISQEAAPYILASGDPRVLQVAIEVDGKDGKKEVLFAYLALEPLAFDREGRIVRAQGWLIQCGPPPPKGARPRPGAKSEDAFVTRHPLPGLKVENGNCTPRDKAAVRGAAKPSRAWMTEEPKPTFWVRDGTN